MLLEVSNLTVCFDKAMIINDLSMHVNDGELVSLVGPNGAGKSTLLRAITGLVIWEKGIHRGTREGDITLEGNVVFEGEHLERMPAHKIVKSGLIHCPERRRPFREMSVIDNIYAGAYMVKDKQQIKQSLDNVYQLFPRLKERSNQISGTLSGGEQQMLALGRALMSNPSCCVSTNRPPAWRRSLKKRYLIRSTRFAKWESPCCSSNRRSAWCLPWPTAIMSFLRVKLSLRVPETN